MSSLRERKRLRTRQALIDAAAKLFERHGYDGTTIADIAAAADISTRTFFSYFASKEDVLFPDADARVKAALTAIDERRPGERPTQILLRALGELGDDAGDDLVGPMAALRLRFVRSVPSVRGRGLQRQLDAQTEIAARLHTAFPDELDEVESAALVGAFVGAIGGALEVLLRDEDEPDVVRERLQRATAVALRPWT